MANKLVGGFIKVAMHSTEECNSSFTGEDQLLHDIDFSY